MIFNCSFICVSYGWKKSVMRHVTSLFSINRLMSFNQSWVGEIFFGAGYSKFWATVFIIVHRLVMTPISDHLLDSSRANLRRKTVLRPSYSFYNGRLLYFKFNCELSVSKSGKTHYLGIQQNINQYGRE